MSVNLLEVTDSDFKAQVLESSLPVLVDFSAEWCPPCRMLDPIVDELAAEYQGRMRVFTLDTDVNQQVVMQYGVMGMPTLILFKNGQPVERITGFKPKDKIVGKLAGHL